MKPEASKPVWMVWCRSDVPATTMAMQSAGWMWCAHGPQGSQSGIEETADAAQGKAYAASIVLADARDWRKGAG